MQLLTYIALLMNDKQVDIWQYAWSVAENKIECVTNPSELKNSVLRIRSCVETVICSTLPIPRLSFGGWVISDADKYNWVPF